MHGSLARPPRAAPEDQDQEIRMMTSEDEERAGCLMTSEMNEQDEEIFPCH